MLRAETGRLHAGLRERGGETPRWLVDRFGGEAERAPMVGERVMRIAVLKDPHRVRGIDMLVAHEPARRVGADGQDCEARPAESRRDVAKDAPSP